MGEILMVFLLLSVINFFNMSSFLVFCFFFFFFSINISLFVSYYISGWLGIILFLVFIGGILVILFYLGMYGTYYSLFVSQNLVLLMLFFFPFSFLGNSFFFNLGEGSFSFLTLFYLSLISGFLYFLLFGVSKILGQGSAMRSFFQ